MNWLRILVGEALRKDPMKLNPVEEDLLHSGMRVAMPRASAWIPTSPAGAANARNSPRAPANSSSWSPKGLRYIFEEEDGVS